jgi:hypothetical protein
MYGVIGVMNVGQKAGPFLRFSRKFVCGNAKIAGFFNGIFVPGRLEKCV